MALGAIKSFREEGAIMRKGISLFICLFLVVLPTVSLAAVYVVDTTTDNGALIACTVAAGDCSLRGAINNVNAGAGGDTITLPAGTYTTTLTGVEDLNAGGDFDIKKAVTITGAGQASTIIDGGLIDRVFHITANVPVTFDGVTIQNAKTTAQGGGIWANSALTLTNSTVTGNTASWGGGIFNGSAGTMAISNTTINQNTASTSGAGAIGNRGALTITDSTISGNKCAANGGAIVSFAPGNITIETSTFSGNSAANWGGAIRNVATLAINNSTISGNSAGSLAGGIKNEGPLTVTNSTITRNSAPTGGGVYIGGTASWSNTIVADQVAGGDCFKPAAGVFTSTGNNLDSDGSCLLLSAGPGDFTDLTFTLPVLANNGGPTMTHSLLTGSLAIDTGACVNVNRPAGDRPPERGNLRYRSL